MAKQTFTTGQILTSAQMMSLQQTALLGGSASGKTASYVLVAADAGTAITMTSAGATTITVNTSLFSAGDIVTLLSLGAGVCTITAGTCSVNTSGSLALSQYQGGVLYFTSTSAAVFFQFATPASGDITAVNPGVGISGGGSSGDVTITNSMATAINAAGDLIYGTGDDAFTRLGIGSAGQVLTVSGGIPSWATASSGGMTLISETVASANSSLSFSSLGSHKQLILMYSGIRHSDNASSFVVRLNNNSGNNYHKSGMSGQGSTLRTGADDPTHLGDSNNATWCAFGVNSNYASLGTDVMGYIVIDNYTSSTKGKAVFTAYHYFNNGGGGYYAQSLNYFVDITSAITSIDIVRLTGTGTFSNTANTTIRLYGVS